MTPAWLAVGRAGAGLEDPRGAWARGTGTGRRRWGLEARPTSRDAALSSAPHPMPTALVTGSNGGVGLALAQKLRDAGWRVVLHGRNPDKLARARDRLGLDDALRADLARPGDVEALAAGLEARTDRLDALVHNAGLLHPTFERAPSGVELTMAVNALAPAALTDRLRPLLERTAERHGGARVVLVTSEAHRGGAFSDVTPEALRTPLDPGRYWSVKAYAQSKLAALAWGLETARGLDGTGVTVNACHPGLVRTGVFDGFGGLTGIVTKAFSVLYLPPSVGAAAPCG